MSRREIHTRPGGPLFDAMLAAGWRSGPPGVNHVTANRYVAS